MRSSLLCECQLYSHLVLKLTCPYFAFRLPNEEVAITENKANVLIKATGVNVEPLQADLFAEALANVNTPTPSSASWCFTSEGPLLHGCCPAEKKVETRKNLESPMMT
jgi:hypothetical protein